MLRVEYTVQLGTDGWKDPRCVVFVVQIKCFVVESVCKGIIFAQEYGDFSFGGGVGNIFFMYPLYKLKLIFVFSVEQ